jgi:tetratricopeptide (TPR) repeat protein
MLATELQASKAALIEAESGDDPAAKEKAQLGVERSKKILGELLVKLAKKEKNALGTRIYIAKLSSTIGDTDTAEKMYTEILPQAEKDPEFAKASIMLRSELIGLLRQKKQYGPALAEAEKLLANNAKVLEPLMEKGRILQEWSETEPKKFPEAVAHWSKLRNMLQGEKKKRPEYFEVAYNAALCLFTEGLKAQEPAKKVEAATTAGQLLNGVMMQSPKLDGPESLAKYHDLLGKIKKVQGTGPAKPPAKAAASK